LIATRVGPVDECVKRGRHRQILRPVADEQKFITDDDERSQESPTMLHPYDEESSFGATHRSPRFGVRTVETVFMHSAGWNPLQATAVRSAVGRLKIDVVMPRRDGSRDRRMPGEPILMGQQSKLRITQVSERPRGRYSSSILRDSDIRKICRSLEI